MKKILYILVLSLFIGGCSDSDDDNSNITFLDKYDGTVWFDADYDQYIRILNNVNNPFEFWSFNDFDDCYYYENVVFSDDITIIKNSNNTFEYESTEIDEGIQYVDRIKITADGDTANVEIKEYEDGDLVDSEVISLEKSSTDVDNFSLCD